MLRLDVAVVGFVVFSLLGPLGCGYLAAWFLDSTGSDAMVALLAGGTSSTAIGAAVGSALGLALSLRFTAGSLLDSFVGAWPEDRSLVTDPRWRLMNLNSRFARKGGDEIQDEVPVGLGGAAGWVGSGAGAVLLGGMSLAAWPSVDHGLIARVGAGTGSALDWLAAAFPVVARILVASILGILAGAAWSTFGGPAAAMEALEDGIDEDLHSLPIVDAQGSAGPERSTPSH
ncbi:MAG TPA: hypothetical protein VL749_02525 [Patescibacteria group bacterium]|nr:hypothetical protein [Patescibacteria group bacterium]